MISRRSVNLGLAAAAAGLVVTVVVSSLASPTTPRSPRRVAASPTIPVSSPTPIRSPEQRVYALSLSELSGLPPDAPPGTPLQLWVAWDPPITRGPKIQILVPRATLERIVPGITPEAPATALLAVPLRTVTDLLYGDRYGALSVTLLR